MNEQIMQIQRHVDGVQIWISVEDLIDLAERHPDNPLTITDTDKFVEEYIDQLQNYAQSNDVENGCSHLEWLMDECIQQVYESGSEAVKAMNEED